MHTGLSFLDVLRVEATQCQTNQDCRNECGKPTKGYCYGGECKCREALKESAIQADASCSKDSDCTSICGKNCKIKNCIGGTCFCEC